MRKQAVNKKYGRRGSKKSLFCVKKDGMNYCDIKDISGFFNELIYIKSQSKKAFSATTPFANANLKAVSIA